MYYNSKNKNIINNKNYYQSNISNVPNQQPQYQLYNIKVSTFKNRPKEKIIEGELNFNYNKVYNNKIPNNNVKTKQFRNMPRKSPIPISKENASNLVPYQKYFINNKYYIQSQNLLAKPKSGYQPKYIINKNTFKPSSVRINSNFTSSKTYNTFNILKKNLGRTHTPFLHSSGSKNGIKYIQKGVVKSKYISKSPILSKGSIFNTYKMYEFGNSNNSGSISSVYINQKIKIKTPIKNNQKKYLISNKNIWVLIIIIQII